MLNKSILENKGLTIHEPAIKHYIKSNRILKDETLHELSSIENFFFSYDFEFEKIRKMACYLEFGDYLILFSCNQLNNSLSFFVFGRIDAESCLVLEEQLWGILQADKFKFNTKIHHHIPNNPKIICSELNFYSERSTPKLVDHIRKTIVCDKISDVTLIYDIPSIEEIDKSINKSGALITIRDALQSQAAGEVKIIVQVYASYDKIESKIEKLDRILEDNTFVNKECLKMHVPGYINLMRTEIIYSNKLDGWLC